MKLTVLGYWGGYPWQGEGTSSYLLEAAGYQLLIDAGSSTLNVLAEVTDPLSLDSVIISHYHHDHIADLGVLQYYRQLHPRGREIPVLPIYGQQEDQAHFASLTLPNVSQGYAYNPAEPLELGPFTITFLETKHPVRCYALRIVERATGKVLVYTADTGYLPTLPAFVRDADLLVADVYFLTGHENHHAHLTSREAGTLARENNVKHLVLSHLQQDLDLAALLTESRDFAGPDVQVELATQKLTLEI